MSDRIIRIGSRGSDLALWQANHVADLLKGIGLASEIQIIKTKGDRIQNLSFDKIEGKGFFTKEIENALLNDEVDLAVHSLKDLESEEPEGLKLGAITKRADARDLLLSRTEIDINVKLGLPQNCKVGTSSARRKSQLLALRTDLNIQDLRGNVPTRIQKLRDGNYDAIVIAMAGVERLNLDVSDLHVQALDPEEYVPAPAPKCQK